ncbi:unnamed protein product [Adineta ricciae]|uniref:Uncharacterized protein n=1 Tax=Adineta ricciae TaxID=249248 RepID=A0A815FBQ0_ADIRI|nr:unnamed protein product [Adineta ricciae]CAF1438606.1 unnamed protein product [Adineta ricciae]
MKKSTCELLSDDFSQILTCPAQQLNPVRLMRPVLENFLIVYFDEHLDENGEDFQNTLTQLQNKVSEVVLFNDMDICLQFMNQLHNEKVIFIISGSHKENLVPEIHIVPQVDSIYLIGTNSTYDKQWNKINGVYDNIRPLVESLSKIVRQANENNVSISFQSTGQNESDSNKNRLEPTFMYTGLFKKVLLEMDHDSQSLNTLVAYYREKYADKSKELESITEFEKEYCPNKAIWYYSKSTFVFGMVNRALRFLEGDLLINMGFFIRDLHYQIEQRHKEYISKSVDENLYFYRGQGLSFNDFEKLKTNKGRLMSFNCFLSTSSDKKVGKMYAESNSDEEGMFGVLFVITVDPKIKSTPFANIERESNYPEEAEILFSMHSVFRIEDIECLDKRQQVYEVQLTLTADDDPELRQLFNQIVEDIKMPTPPTKEELRTLLLWIGQYDTAEKFYLDLLNQSKLLIDEIYCYINLGRINERLGKYDAAFEYYAKVFSIVINARCYKADNFFRTYYKEVGSLYCETGDYSNALICLEKSLDIHKKLHSLDNIEADDHYNNIGMVYYHMGKYDEALSRFNQVLLISKKFLPPNHINLAHIHLNIGACYAQMQDHTTALSHNKMAVSILEKVLPDNHPSLANAYNTFAGTYKDNGNVEEAFIYYQKALRIHEENGSTNRHDFAPICLNLGRMYLYQHDYDNAMLYLNNALIIFQQTLPEGHESLAVVYCAFGEAHLNQEDFVKAVSYYEKALHIYQACLSDDHPNLATGYKNMGVVYCRIEKYEEALECLEKCLAILKKRLGDNHSSLVSVCIEIAYAYEKQGEYGISIMYLQKALGIHRSSGLPPCPEMRRLLHLIETSETLRLRLAINFN